MNEMLKQDNKTKCRKITLFNRPGATICSGCGKKFSRNEAFYVCESKVNRFRGDDEVSFFCSDCWR